MPVALLWVAQQGCAAASLTLLGAGRRCQSRTPGTRHILPNPGLPVRMAEVRCCGQWKTLAAPQAHFHSQPGLGAPLVLLDKAQHGSGFDLLLNQV